MSNEGPPETITDGGITLTDTGEWPGKNKAQELWLLFFGKIIYRGMNFQEKNIQVTPGWQKLKA